MAFEVNGMGAVIGVTRRASERLRTGHLWVYRSDVERVQPAELAGGALVSVVDGRGIALGTALYSDSSEIALRMVSRQAGVGREAYLGEARERVRAAIRLRERLVTEAFSGDETNACRLAFSEADELPGIVMDRYGELVVVQLLTQGTAQDDVRGVLAEVLAELSWAETVRRRLCRRCSPSMG
jgi:23S rRNA (cytosine1962-C5)-methyltransferase